MIGGTGEEEQKRNCYTHREDTLNYIELVEINFVEIDFIIKWSDLRKNSHCQPFKPP